MNHHRLFAQHAVVLGCCISMVGSGTAWAQASAANDADSLEEVVVTGSRVITNGNNSPTPVTIVTTEQLLQNNPSNVQEAVLSLPVFGGNQNGPSRTPGNANQNAAVHNLNLRNFGITRTLVLFDGRRVPPTSPLGEVDADLVPSMLLQRVDIVTGGASAVYGSDAITGVVNFITDRKYNGLKVDAQVGRSQRGDGDEQRIGIAAGMDLFGGRGHIEGSYEYYNSPGILTRLGREWGQNVWTVQGAGTVANPIRLVRNTRLSATSFLGYITAANPATNPLRDMVFRQNGVLDRFQHGTPTGSSGAESGGDGGYFNTASLLSLFQSDQVFGRFDYDLTDNVHLWVQGVGKLSHNLDDHQVNEYRNVTLSAQNAFLAPQYQQQLAAAGVTTFVFSKMMAQSPTWEPDTYTSNYMAMAGLEGKFGGWHWDISYINSKNSQTTRNRHAMNTAKGMLALDAVTVTAANVGSSGQPLGSIVCNVVLTNPSVYPGCIPINLFGPTSESAAAINQFIQTTSFVADTSQDDIGGTIAGAPFSTWAGPVNIALSGEYRKQSRSITSSNPLRPADCTGIRFNNCKPATLEFFSDVRANAPEVSQSVKEVALETNVPLLADKPFFKALDLSAAVRYTMYDTSGNVTTWKVGADWRVNDQLTFRGTRSRDIRAPNLNELFAPPQVTQAGVQDLHTGGGVGQAPSITRSNPNLQVEVADAFTAGVVYRPSFLPNASVAIDYYKIKMANAITQIQGTNATIQNLCEVSNGTSEFCKLFDRPLPFSDHSPANFPTAFYSDNLNTQSQITDGVDFELNYVTKLRGGTLSLRDLLGYQPHLTSVQFPGAATLEAGGTANNPAWRMTFYVRYELGNYSIDVQERWRSIMGWNADPTLVYVEPAIPSAAYTNLSLSYKRNAAQYFVTIRNLFDKQPAPYGQIGGASAVPGLFGGYPNGDDTIGRYFNVGVHYRR